MDITSVGEDRRVFGMDNKHAGTNKLYNPCNAIILIEMV